MYVYWGLYIGYVYWACILVVCVQVCVCVCACVCVCVCTCLYSSPFSSHHTSSPLSVDDEDRENEGDLIMAADLATPETLHFIIDNTSGVVCVGMLGSDLDRLRIPLMVTSQENDESMSTAFTITVDLREGTTTGISASDRAATILALADPTTQPDDLRRPGHIFPLRSRPGGVLTRPGHTEASVDLAFLAGRAPAGVMCEVVNRSDGSMARTPELLAFARTHGLRCVTIADLVRYRLATEMLAVPMHDGVAVRPMDGAPSVRVQQFTAMDGCWHVVALWNAQQEGPLHVHRQDLLADVFGMVTDVSSSSLSNGHSAATIPTVRDAAQQVTQHGGTLIYIRPQQGRTLPDHLIKTCSKAPGGGQRALELAVARAVLRVIRGDDVENVGVEVGMMGEHADQDAACWAWWDAQQHPEVLV